MTYNSSKTGAQVDEAVTKTQNAGATLLGTGNTPIQSNATDLILDSGAKLGIGTGTPAASADIRTGAVPLHIHGDADLPGVALHNTAGQLKWAIASRGVSGDTLFFSASPSALTGTEIASAAQMSLLQNGEFRIGTPAAERLRIDSIGNLLVGTTSTTGEKVQIDGDLKVTGNQRQINIHQISIPSGTATDQTIVADLTTAGGSTGLSQGVKIRVWTNENGINNTSYIEAVAVKTVGSWVLSEVGRAQAGNNNGWVNLSISGNALQVTRNGFGLAGTITVKCALDFVG